MKIIIDPKYSGECFFSENYEKARERFIKTANSAGFLVTPIKIQDSLTMDIAVKKGAKDRLLVHLSGVHGPEGFAGSAIQTSYMSLLNTPARQYIDSTENPTEIFVHAVNPYGFAFNRRVNEDNIDLNRNFLTKQEFDFVGSRDPNFAGYVVYDNLLNPKGKYYNNDVLNRLYGWWLFLKSLISDGILPIKRAMVSGNYYKPEGLYYGGKKQTTSVKKLIGFLDHFLANNNNFKPNFDRHRKKNHDDNDNDNDEREIPLRKVILIDVHTGLGDPGVDTLNVHPNSAKLANIIYHDDCEDVKEGIIEYTGKDNNAAMSGYDLMMGGTTDYFCGAYNGFSQLDNGKMGKAKMCVTQEFGTVSPGEVGLTLINENMVYHYVNDTKEKFKAGKQLKNVFFIDKVKWKRDVVSRGWDVIRKSKDWLMDDDTRDMDGRM
jgi:hypothetical protein